MVYNDKGPTHVEPWHYSTRRILLCVLCNKTSHTDTAHVGVIRLTHPYKHILTPSVMCSQQLPVLSWIILLTLKFCFTELIHSAFTFQILLPCRIHIFWLDSIRLTSSNETQRNKTHKRTPNTQRKRTWAGIKYSNMIHKNSKSNQEAPLHDREKLTLLDA